MANTTNLDLVKPLGTDHALVAQINSNSDKIDAEAGRTRANFAAEYSASSAYAVGAFCTHNGILYQCNTAIGSGGEAWTAGHWTQISAGDAIVANSQAIAGKANNSTKIAKAVSITTSTTLTCTGVSVNIPAGKEFAILAKATYQNNEPLEIALSTSNTAIRSYNTVARSDNRSTISFAGYTDPDYIGSLTLYVWARYASSGQNDIDVSGYYR